MAISGVCKVEFANYVETKVSEGLEKKEIIEAFAKDADISEDTVKHWMYPEAQKKAEKKYQEKSKDSKKSSKSAETSTRQDSDEEQVTPESGTVNVLTAGTEVTSEGLVFSTPQDSVVGPVSESSDNFMKIWPWKKEMKKQLDFASDILNGEVVLKDHDSKFAVRECFSRIDEFIRLYIKKRKNKELPF